MSLTERYQRALERERVAVSFRTPEAKKVMRKVFEKAEGNTISDRIISVLQKGLKAESKGDRVDREYREDKESFDWAKYLEDEPISKESSREEKDEWFNEKAEELNERLDKVESELKKDFNLKGDSKMQESEKIQELRQELAEMKMDEIELDEEIQKRLDDGELSKSEAYREQLQNMHKG